MRCFKKKINIKNDIWYGNELSEYDTVQSTVLVVGRRYLTVVRLTGGRGNWPGSVWPGSVAAYWFRVQKVAVRESAPICISRVHVPSGLTLRWRRCILDVKGIWFKRNNDQSETVISRCCNSPHCRLCNKSKSTRSCNHRITTLLLVRQRGHPLVRCVSTNCYVRALYRYCH